MLKILLKMCKSRKGEEKVNLGRSSRKIRRCKTKNSQFNGKQSRTNCQDK